MFELTDEKIPLHYKINQDEETLAFDGRELRQGMIIALAEDDYRDDSNTRSRRRLWCRVSENYPVSVRKFEDIEEIQFVAEYYDGHIAKIFAALHTPWMVKKDSIKETEKAKIHSSRDTSQWDEPKFTLAMQFLKCPQDEIDHMRAILELHRQDTGCTCQYDI